MRIIITSPQPQPEAPQQKPHATKATLRSTATLTPWLLMLVACSSPPKPPTVDESNRRPANAQQAVELQVCRNELEHARLLAVESSRVAEATGIRLAYLSVQQQVLAAVQRPAQADTRACGGNSSPAQAAAAATSATATATTANTIYSVRFNYGSTQVAIPPALASALLQEARTAPLVLLRGRTDGTSDLPGESRIARQRTEAVRAYLLAAGVDPARIRSTHQPSGDHVASNDTAAGRSLNRRVEIELYRQLPVLMDPATTAAAAQQAGSPKP